MRPEPDRVRLAAEALARARADAWARGERPSAAPRPAQAHSDSSERPEVTASSPLSSSWFERPRRDDPQSLKTALGGLLSARGWREQAAVGGVFGKWEQIVGPQVAAHIRPESFADGELSVVADSDAWATQAKLLAAKLLERLAEELGAGTVRRIRVRGPGSSGRPGRRAKGGRNGLRRVARHGGPSPGLAPQHVA